MNRRDNSWCRILMAMAVLTLWGLGLATAAFGGEIG